MKSLSIKATLLGLCLLLVASLASAETFFGEVTGVDTLKQRVFLRGNIMLSVSPGSRILDMEGNRMTLLELKNQLEEAYVSETERIGGLVPYANYSVVEARGTLIVEEMQLTELPQ